MPAGNTNENLAADNGCRRARWRSECDRQAIHRSIARHCPRDPRRQTDWRLLGVFRDQTRGSLYVLYQGEEPRTHPIDHPMDMFASLCLELHTATPTRAEAAYLPTWRKHER